MGRALRISIRLARSPESPPQTAAPGNIAETYCVLNPLIGRLAGIEAASNIGPSSWRWNLWHVMQVDAILLVPTCAPPWQFWQTAIDGSRTSSLAVDFSAWWQSPHTRLAWRSCGK